MCHSYTVLSLFLCVHIIYNCCAFFFLLVTKKVAGIFDSMSDDDDEFFTPSINKTISKSAEPKETKKELTESDKKALRYITCYTRTNIH